MKEDFIGKLGQLFFVGIRGYNLTNNTKKFLQAIQPGGIIFFENNIKNKKQVKKLIRDINACLKIKLFIAVDQEGGSVERLRNICTSLPSVWGLSKVGLRELLIAQSIIAKELQNLGFNLNFAPVLDINSNPKNPVIGTRSISNDPNIVASYGASIINQFLKTKIIPVAKHFPGHGDLDTDSHFSLPILNKTNKELNKFELVPFKKAIKHNVPIIMVSHIQLPKIETDKARPASLSKNILKGLLREEIKFKGLIVTDELNMKAVTNNYSLQEACYEAIKAGTDLLLFNLNESSTLSAYKYIKERAKKDKELLNRIEESYKRIVLVKNKFLNKRSTSIKPLTSSVARKIAYKLASKVIHWVRKDFLWKPLSKGETIEVIYPITHRLKKEDLINIFAKLGLNKYALHSYDLNPTVKEIKSLVKKIRKNSRKILITYDAMARVGQKELIHELYKSDLKLILISVGLEYDLELAPHIRNFIAAYAPNHVSLLAAFRILSLRSFQASHK